MAPPFRLLSKRIGLSEIGLAAPDTQRGDQKGLLILDTKTHRQEVGVYQNLLAGDTKTHRQEVGIYQKL